MTPFFMSEQPSLLSVAKLTIRRGGRIILHDINFDLKPGEYWTITGPMGSGKSTFLQALSGQFHAPPGSLERRVPVEFVSFKEESSRFSYSSYFYQQRYQATMSDRADDGYTAIPSLRDFLQATDSSEDGALLDRLGLSPLLDRSFIKLSNGQTRKARIGKALLKHPSVLLLDNPFVGLDGVFRNDLTNWLGDLTKHGLTLVLVNDATDIPDFSTHVAVMENGTLSWAGPKEHYTPEHHVKSTTVTPPVLQTKPQRIDFSEAFRLQNVSVRYGDTIILDGLDWVVKAGERWALFGPNGVGKSVLLSLLYGDHPQAYSNYVSVFGHRRGKSGESIWDVKRRIGFVSPELHLYFPPHLTVRQVALSGLTDTLTPPNRVMPETELDLTNLLAYFGLAGVDNRTFGTLSTGEQRVILLIRAFLKNPAVLLLDEPFQAIDSRHVDLARQLIDHFSDKTILFVTHNCYELPESINQLYTLDINKTRGEK
ncbi:ATP-binding cassette domain-containing protein [Spirosoma sp.]|uniref:ATP-binding cassette domain-containing protein n=1 Tax=Spirosoma sp. TaxID=1899569 RepID=UPI002613C903|nr:ATP-binding cassette domain-containing protein [Spirosoma sp.]MCX6214031.1 ATP-binding cassette domain-containing protein [Spirosoma sp.]